LADGNPQPVSVRADCRHVFHAFVKYRSLERHMELRHVRYFIALAEELHFGRAAKRLFITQPPLSFNIQQLEKYLDAQLFVRDSRNVSLTPMGEAFLPEARRIMAQARRAEETVRAIRDGQSGLLQIGFTSSMLYRGMTPLLQAFANRHPAVDFELHDMTIGEQVKALGQGRIHAGFMPALALPRGLDGVSLLDDTYACCVHESHWAAQRSQIALRELEHETFVVFSRELTVSGHEYVLSMCVNAGFHPRVRYFARQWLTAAALVAQGFGVALMPSSLQRTGLPNVRFVPLEGAAPTTSYFVWDPAGISPTLKTLIGGVRGCMEHIIDASKPMAAGPAELQADTIAAH
jgi:DNA-binding transcriptional LysR family regulator